jgi:hypothetical protein
MSPGAISRPAPLKVTMKNVSKQKFCNEDQHLCPRQNMLEMAYMHSKAPRPLLKWITGCKDILGKSKSPVMSARIITKHAHVRCVTAACKTLHKKETNLRETSSN